MATFSLTLDTAEPHPLMHSLVVRQGDTETTLSVTVTERGTPVTRGDRTLEFECVRQDGAWVRDAECCTYASGATWTVRLPAAAVDVAGANALCYFVLRKPSDRYSRETTERFALTVDASATARAHIGPYSDQLDKAIRQCELAIAAWEAEQQREAEAFESAQSARASAFDQSQADRASEFAQEQAQRAEAFDQAQDQRADAFDGAEAQRNAASQSAEAARDAAFDSACDEWAGRADSAIAEAAQRMIAELRAEYEDAVADAKAIAQENTQRIASLHDIWIASGSTLFAPSSSASLSGSALSVGAHGTASGTTITLT